MDNFVNDVVDGEVVDAVVLTKSMGWGADSRSETLSEEDRLGKILDAFLDRRRSKNTREAYRRDILEFFRYVDSQKVMNPDASVEKAQSQDIAKYLHSMSGYSESTVNRKAAALSAFYRFLVNNTPLAVNPVREVERHSVSATHSSTEFLTPDESRRLYQVAKDDGALWGALVGLMLSTGMRVSEAIMLRESDIRVASDADGRSVRVASVKAKGGEYVDHRLPPATLVDLMTLTKKYEWLENDTVVKAGDSGVKDDWIFRSPRDCSRHVDRHVVSRKISHLAKKAGIEKNITAHSLRHSAATSALRAGESIENVSTMLGHSSLTVTQRYVHSLKKIDNSTSTTLANMLYS